MEKVEKKLHSFTAVFEPAPEGGYVVYVPALPGCSTQGETFEEAQVNAKDAIEGYLQVMKDLNEDIAFESESTIISRIPAVV
ncbi:MAG TPA: type II toxin-antitoxin system HicB family antitoxin [Candidatus Andersenbacteria bacterium]|nr:type II toxin-antitoxin system HicB family antitoxin [Candidatus Andersenbacteria bacterium]